MKNKRIKLSVVLATRNEETNIARCLASVKSIADEIIVFDEHSLDKTREIARSFGAKVFETTHNDNFHITKQKAIDKARGEWILQLDADEVVTPPLAGEIREVVGSSNNELLKRVLGHDTNRTSNTKKVSLFLRHQNLIEKREGHLGKESGEVVAFFVPRINVFLGAPLVHAGVYPDGVIRLIKSGKAKLPAKSVHELMDIEGEVGWLFNNLEHYDSPTMRRYVWRMNRYTDLHARELMQKGISKNFFYFVLYSIFKPIYTFTNLFLRHKGFLDGPRGFLWSFFSAMHFPLAYYKYWSSDKDGKD